MPLFYPIQTNFTAGEWSPRLDSRVDLAKFKNSLGRLENFTVWPHGGATRRVGTIHVTEVKTSSLATRVLPFLFSVTQGYIIELGNLYARFVTNQDIVPSGGPAEEITTPWLTANLFQIDYAQSADVLYMVHEDHPVQKIERLTATTFQITEVAFTGGPFLDENTTTTTITVSGVTGSITLTASAAIFLVGHIGALWKLSEVKQSLPHDAWVAGEASIAQNELRANDGKVYRNTTSGSTNAGTRQPVHESGSQSDGLIVWLFVHDGAGIVKITAFTSTTVVTATVQGDGEIPSSVDTQATTRWNEGLYSDVQGHPAAVTFYEERLFLAGATNNPQRFDGSRAGDFENFTGGTLDDDAVAYTLASNQVNAIRALEASTTLLAFTFGGEWAIRGAAQDEPITPTNIQAKQQTTFGSAQVKPIRVGNVTLFLQRTKRKLRELIFSIEDNGLIAGELSILAEHITLGGIDDMAYAHEPDSLVWMVRNDGKLIGATYERAQDVIAFHKHTFGGTGVAVESVAVIPAPDGSYDEAYFVVQRTINSATVRHIEYMGKPIDDDTAQEDLAFLDSQVVYDSTAATSITGLSHLEGETVGIVADGAALPDGTVSSSAITITPAASVVHVGLKYTSLLETQPPEIPLDQGSPHGKGKIAHKVSLRFYKTLGAMAGESDSRVEDINFRVPSDPMDSPPPLFTGNKEVKLTRAIENLGSVVVKTTGGLPLNLLSVVTELEILDG